MTDTPSPSNAPEEGSHHLGLFGALIAVAFACRAMLIHHFPTVYSWDAFTRLLDPTRLLVRHWMPIPQVPIFLTDLAGGDIFAVRLVYAALGTAGAAFVGWYSLKSQGQRAGLATLVLAAALPSFVIYTLVPYQEGSLVLFLFAFLCAWKIDPSEMSRFARVAAATCLALACLCRYEAWVFAGLFALRPMIERRGRDLWIFAPSVLAIGWWLLTLPTLDTTNPMATLPATDASEAALSPLIVVAKAIWLSVEEFHYVGLPLAVVGAVVAFRRGGLFGREMVLCWIALYALTVYRSIHTTLATERMMILPLVVATLYVPTGLVALSELVAVDPKMRRIACGAIVAALVFSFGLAIQDSLKHRTRRYGHERGAAYQLELLMSEQGPNRRVGIVPRSIENTWGESRLKAIFGQSMKLRPDDSRLVLGLDRVLEEQASLDRIVVFDADSDHYQILIPPKGSPDQSTRPDPLASAQNR